jgi:hypothetical protein
MALMILRLVKFLYETTTSGLVLLIISRMDRIENTVSYCHIL